MSSLRCNPRSLERRNRPGRLPLGLLFAALLLAAALPLRAAGQTATPPAGGQAALQVIIDRPGEGETYYTGADGPRTTVPIVGRVIGGDFDLAELEVQLEVLKDGTSMGRETGAVNADGQFSFRALINANGSAELGTPESNCYLCHGLEPVEIPQGSAVVRVTAVEPTGRAASAERRVSLDQAGVAMIAVQTIASVAGRPGQAVAGLIVDATTRVYDWRSRKFTALTDAQGRAVLRVEALSLAPTHYRINIAPMEVDGVMYRAVEPLQFEVPAGATTAGPVDLAVEAQLGGISGTVAGPDGTPLTAPLAVRAVQAPYGRAFTGAVTTGHFTLTGLPMGDYLLAVDPGETAAPGSAPVQHVSVAGAQTVTVALTLAAGSGATLSGALRDAQGAPLPFGWATAGAAGTGVAVVIAPAAPPSGEFALSDLPSGARTVAVSAPGYWSRQIPARTITAGSAAGLEVRLQPKPGTHAVPWGTGSFVVPDGTLASVNGVQVKLQRGWLWGRGDASLTITMPEAEIALHGGSFALEYLPGETGWLYVFAGDAAITRPGVADVKVGAGQMAAFAGFGITRPAAVPLDAGAIRLLGASRTLPVVYEPRPGAWARVQDAAAGIGIMNLSPLGAGASVLVFVFFTTGAVVVVRGRRRRAPAGGAHHGSEIPTAEPTPTGSGAEDEPS